MHPSVVEVVCTNMISSFTTFLPPTMSLTYPLLCWTPILRHSASVRSFPIFFKFLTASSDSITCLINSRNSRYSSLVVNSNCGAKGENVPSSTTRVHYFAKTRGLTTIIFVLPYLYSY